MLLNHLHFICLARGLDVTRPVIITNALTSINNHIIIEHNNYYLSFLQDMFPYFEKYGLINVLPDIISRIELLMNEKESTIKKVPAIHEKSPQMAGTIFLLYITESPYS